VDGRTARAARNRQTVIDAALALIEEGDLRPTAQTVAERAGVATRSVFHHFADLESLYRDVADTQAARHWGLLHPVAGDLTVRITATVALRAELYERIGATRRAAVLLEHDSPVLADRLRQSRSALRSHLRQNLPELNDLERVAREACYAAASWENWEVLRRHQGLAVGAATSAVGCVLTSLLAAVPTAAR
jgi:TetR/AcrR family transcriptional regulator, regulator of autoinduction and epiphytic fitness